MAHLTKRYWVVLTGGVVAAGTQLLEAQSASAHSGPHEDETVQSEMLETDEHHKPSSESAAAQELSNPDKADSDVMPKPSAEIKESAENETPIQEVTAAPPSAASQASLADGFSIGLGEPLLGLVIAGPFLLASLKNRSNRDSD